MLNYLLRLTAASGYKNLILLLRDERYLLANNRLADKKIFFKNFDLERIATLANIEAAQPTKLSFKHTFNTRCLAFGQWFLNTLGRILDHRHNQPLAGFQYM